MVDLDYYIVLIGFVEIPILVCGGVITETREAKKSDNIVKFVIACSVSAIFLFSALTPMIATAFLKSSIFNRVVFCVYLVVNLFIHLRFIEKKTNGKINIERCKNLKNIWLCSLVMYSLLFGYCLFKSNEVIIILAAVFYAIYNCCMLAFDYYFREEPFKEWEKVKHELVPLREISIGQYREWSKRRELKLRKRTLLFAALYQGVFIILLLAAAKRITLAAVLIIALLYCLTLGSLAFSWSKRLKDIESRLLESVYRGQAFIETVSPIRVRYMDSEGEFQSRVVEKVQRKKYKQGTLVDIVMENGEVVLAERNLPE